MEVSYESEVCIKWVIKGNTSVFLTKAQIMHNIPYTENRHYFPILSASDSTIVNKKIRAQKSISLRSVTMYI